MIDIVTAVLDRASINYRIKGYPAKRLYRNLASGKTNIFLGPKKVPVYEGKTLHSKFIIAEGDLRVYTMGDKELPATKEG